MLLKGELGALLPALAEAMVLEIFQILSDYSLNRLVHSTVCQ
jgi:hypothetical protein